MIVYEIRGGHAEDDFGVWFETKHEAIAAAKEIMRENVEEYSRAVTEDPDLHAELYTKDDVPIFKVRVHPGDGIRDMIVRLLQHTSFSVESTRVIW